MTMDEYAAKAGQRDFMYILRRTIVPWRWREALDEAVEYCKKYRIDELCVFIDSGTFTHYYPDEKWLADYQKILFEVKKSCDANGIIYSLNPNVTQGHGDRGRHIAALHPDWDMCTGSDGTSADDCACSSSKPWRKYISSQWELYAETHPAVIWLEDDMRTSFHGAAGRGCFCKTHIREFNKRNSLSLTREELVKAIFSSPCEIRTKWIHFLDDITNETVKMLEETVHKVSPETVIGLMSNDIKSHAVEGRDWEKFKLLAAGKNGTLTVNRPPLGNYTEGSLEGLRYTFNSTCITRREYGYNSKPKTLFLGEIENFPYTNYSKSNTFMRLQCAAAICGGCNALTLNLFDHSGTPMKSNIELLETLRDSKDFLSALKERHSENARSNGIGIYYNANAPHHKKSNFTNCSYDIYPEGLAANETLQDMGFGTSFEHSSRVTVLCGQDIRAASEKEILSLLGKSLFIDAGAFMALDELGYSEYIGGTLEEHFPLSTKYPVAGEHFFNERFGGDALLYFDTAIHTSRPEFAAIRHSGNVEILSEMVDVERKSIFPCAYTFINKLGGRMAVHPLEYAGLSSGFATPERKSTLHSIFKWLFNGELPVFMTGRRRSLTFRMENSETILAGAMNLSLDTLKNVNCILECENKITKIEHLEENGKWTLFNDFRQTTASTLEIRMDSLDFKEPAFFILTKGK